MYVLAVVRSTRVLIGVLQQFMPLSFAKLNEE